MLLCFLTMKVVLTLLCRNESDIISSTIDFHLARGVDFIIVTDNSSVDSTPLILERYKSDQRVLVLHESSHTHDQGVWVTRMARLAASKFSADWLIHSDADEFWWSSDSSIKQCLSSVPPHVFAFEVERFNFLPPIWSYESSATPFYNAQTLRERASKNSLGLPLPPKICHRAHPSITVNDGNHSVTLFDAPIISKKYSYGLEILHFPVRSYNQLVNKIKLGAEALMRNPTLPTHVGITWRSLYSRYKSVGHLYDYYFSLQPNPKSMAELLASGEIINDTRLSDFLSQLPPYA